MTTPASEFMLASESHTLVVIRSSLPTHKFFAVFRHGAAADGRKGYGNTVEEAIADALNPKLEMPSV